MVNAFYPKATYVPCLSFKANLLRRALFSIYELKDTPTFPNMELNTHLKRTVLQWGLLFSVSYLSTHSRLLQQVLLNFGSFYRSSLVEMDVYVFPKSTWVVITDGLGIPKGCWKKIIAPCFTLLLKSSLFLSLIAHWLFFILPHAIL